MADSVNFTIKASMSERWVPHFLGLLREMQTLGNVGSSRTVGFYADGDGDYRPTFEWDTDAEPAPATTTKPMQTDSFWDAG